MLLLELVVRVFFETRHVYERHEEHHDDAEDGKAQGAHVAPSRGPQSRQCALDKLVKKLLSKFKTSIRLASDES